MAATLGVFSADQVVITIDGVDIGKGLAEGDDAVMIEPTTEDAVILKGADGSNVASFSQNRGVDVTLKLLPGSDAHNFLLTRRTQGRSGGARVFSFGAR